MVVYIVYNYAGVAYFKAISRNKLAEIDPSIFKGNLGLDFLREKS